MKAACCRRSARRDGMTDRPKALLRNGTGSSEKRQKKKHLGVPARGRRGAGVAQCRENPEGMKKEGGGEKGAMRAICWTAMATSRAATGAQCTRERRCFSGVGGALKAAPRPIPFSVHALSTPSRRLETRGIHSNSNCAKAATTHRPCGGSDVPPPLVSQVSSSSV